MLPVSLLRCAPLLVLLVLAAGTDLRDRRIPNWLTLLLIVGGLGQSFTANHLAGPLGSTLGIFAGAAIPLVLFVMGALGAGDVKLMAGVGAWIGPIGALSVFALAAVIGMVIVLAQAAATGRLRILAGNSLAIALSVIHVRELGTQHASETGRASRSVDRPLPYAVPVLAAVCCLLLARWR